MLTQIFVAIWHHTLCHIELVEHQLAAIILLTVNNFFQTLKNGAVIGDIGKEGKYFYSDVGHISMG